MRKPAFMEGTLPVPVADLTIVPVDPARIRSVSWMPTPKEVAAPRMEVVAPPVVKVAPHPDPLPAVRREREFPADFVPLESAPPPTPPPPAFSPLAEQKLEAALAALNAEGERLAEQARADALELGILIARRIVEREISLNLESVFSLIKSALRKVGEENVTRVRLHPRDVERFEAAVQSDFSLGKIELVGDAALQPGDVMVDTHSHTIGGRLSTRFDELVRQLDGAL